MYLFVSSTASLRRSPLYKQMMSFSRIECRANKPNPSILDFQTYTCCSTTLEWYGCKHGSSFALQLIHKHVVSSEPTSYSTRSCVNVTNKTVNLQFHNSHSHLDTANCYILHLSKHDARILYLNCLMCIQRRNHNYSMFSVMFVITN